MSALLSLVVADDNGNEFEVDVKSRTVLQWEKRFPGRSVAHLQDRFQYIYEVAFIAAKGKLPEGTEFEAFCDNYDVTPKDEAPSDPTQPAA